jgi:hypothetical protein
MSTSNNGKSFEDQLREKLAGHEYEYHPSQWAKMQQKLNAHLHAASAAKTAVLKKTLYSAAKITGGLISAGAIVYTALSLAGIVDRTDLGFGENKRNTPLANEQVRASQSFNENTNRNELAFGNPALRAPEDFNRNLDNPGSAIRGSSHYKTNGNEFDTRNALHSRGDNPRLVSDNGGDNTSGRETQENGREDFTSNTNNQGLASTNKEQDNSSLTGNAPENKGDNSEVKVEGPADKDSAAADNPVNPLNPDDGKYADKDEVKPFKPQIGLMGGAGLAFAKSNPGDKGVTPTIDLNMIGAFVAVPINARITLQPGIEFRNQNGWDFRETSSQIEYSLYKDSTFTEYAITSGQYIDFPLVAKYKLTSKLQLFGGAKLNWLQSTHGTLSEGHFRNENYEAHNSRDMYGKPHGFHAVDWDVSAGMEYRFNKLFSLGAAYHYGLNDIRHTYNNSTSEPVRNSYIQMYAAMRLF